MHNRTLITTAALAVVMVAGTPLAASATESHAFTPYTESDRWILPATWDPAVTPTYQAAIFPQDRLVGELPCGRWSQDDTYLIDSLEDVAIYASLGDVLEQDEDAAIYQSHVFTYGGDCIEEPPAEEEPPVDEQPPAEEPVDEPEVSTPRPVEEPPSAAADIPAAAVTPPAPELAETGAGDVVPYLLLAAALLGAGGFLVRRAATR
jgi:hypothetical protein